MVNGRQFGKQRSSLIGSVSSVRVSTWSAGGASRWRWGFVGALLVIGVLVLRPSVASAATFGNYFSSGNGAAGATAAADAPGGRGEAIELKLPSATSYAGFLLGNVPASPPTTPPSFWFKSSVTGASAGSPRLVIAFSDGDSIDLRPLAWTANRWTKVDGASASWEDAGSGGGCATIRDVTYQQALACHLGGGATVSSAYVVADGVAYANGVVVDIDLATYGGADVTSGIKEATAKLQTTTLRVNRKTGRGRLTTGCALPPGDHCHVALTLTHRGQTIGTMTGTLDGSLDGQLKVTLNGRGRGLLQHARKLSAVVSGAIVNDVGFGFRLRESVTIRS